MTLDYYPDVDQLYIDLSDSTSVDSEEVSDGVVLDFDSEGRVVGIDIEHASKKVDLDKLVVIRLPGSVEISARGEPSLHAA